VDEVAEEDLQAGKGDGLRDVEPRIPHLLQASSKVTVPNYQAMYLIVLIIDKLINT
jgi:hypothetical protein